MRAYLEAITNRRDLTRDEARDVFFRLVRGELEPVHIAALLCALRTKGETTEEIAGAAQALREAAVPFDTGGRKVADTCGTGGDGAHTINISTAVAFVAAALGIPVVKHGNRSISSQCGSADVLEALGVRVDAPAEVQRRCLDEVGLCFLFAPAYHPGLRHAGPVRRQLGIRTVMNILGPLVNPARPAYQVLGVFDPALCAPMATVLAALECERALVVHGSGLDELAVHGPTRAALLQDGAVSELEITPDQAGVSPHPLEALVGGDAQRNAAALSAVLSGKGAPAHADAVALNAGAVAWMSGRCEDLRTGVQMAHDVLSSGKAAALCSAFAECSRDH